MQKECWWRIVLHNSNIACKKNMAFLCKSDGLVLLLSEDAATPIAKHVEFYAWKGFLTKLVGVKAMAEFMGVPERTLHETLIEYADAAKAGIDAFGKNRFLAVPNMDDSEKVIVYLGKVEPVLHYCMGGLKIDTQGQVQGNEKSIPGLYACGEVSGGLHGENRLAGNSLCECVVFGRIIGQVIASTCSSASKI